MESKPRATLPHGVWSEPHPTRTGYVGKYQTARGVRTVASVLSKRVALIFPTEIAALKAATAALCRDLDATPKPPSAEVKEFAVHRNGRNTRTISLR